MTAEPTPSWPAASSPARDRVELAVDGSPRVGDDDDLGLRDADGTPTFSCRARSLLADAGRAGSAAPCSP